MLIYLSISLSICLQSQVNGFSESGILSAWVLLLFGWGGLTADDVWINYISWLQNNLCKFPPVEHKFKRVLTKLVLNVCFKNFWYKKIYVGQKYLLWISSTTPQIQNIISDQVPLFLEFNSKMKLEDQLIYLKTILKIGGLSHT